MTTRAKLLLVILLIIATGQTQAQTIDSFHVNRSVNPHELFVRLHFPDSSYYISHTFERVAFIYPPVNLVTFFYRSCQYVKADPVRDTTVFLYTPEPYGLWVILASDTNTVTPGCTFSTQMVASDTAIYTSPPTGISNTANNNKVLRIFPNPAYGVLHVVGVPGSELQISDGLGRLLVRQKLQNDQETINISSLIPGLYYIHCYRDRQLLQSLCFSKLP